MAAYFPVEPKIEDKQNAITFMRGFMQFGLIDNVSFSRKFLKIMDKSMNTLEMEKSLNSREEFTKWMCVQHNIFKIERLHPEFDEMSIE